MSLVISPLTLTLTSDDPVEANPKEFSAAKQIDDFPSMQGERQETLLRDYLKEGRNLSLTSQIQSSLSLLSLTRQAFININIIT